MRARIKAALQAQGWLEKQDGGVVALPVGPAGEVVGEGFSLAQGMGLGDGIRAGGVMARLLGRPEVGVRWVVIGIRPAGSRVRLKSETDAGQRIIAAARLVDAPLAGVWATYGRTPGVREILFPVEG